MTWVFLVVMFVSLFIIPLSLPGLWIMMAVSIAAWLLHYMTWLPMLCIVALTLFAELIEFMLVGKMTKRYGGSRKAFWGAILGGGAGVFLGAPVPVLGSIVAGFVGAFFGAFVVTFAETRQVGSANRVGFGAVVGRALTAVAKTAAGLAILIVAAAAMLHR